MEFVPRTMGARAQTELKYFDSYIAATAVASGATWAGTELDPAGNCLFYPSEGSDINDRVGRKVTIKKIKLRGLLFYNAQAAQNAADDECLCRIIMYMDMQTNAAQAQGEDLMAGPGAAEAKLCLVTHQNTANFGRFRVLRDKIYNVSDANMCPLTDAGNTVVVNGKGVIVKFNYTFKKPLVVRFNATNGGSVADIIDNSFHVIGKTTSTLPTPQFCYQCRVVYTDN